MELVQAQKPPRLGQRLGRPAVQRRECLRQLGVMEQDLRLSVGALDPALAGQDAAMAFEVELPLPDGQALRLLLQRFEIGAHGRRHHLRRAGHGAIGTGLADQLVGRPATAVAIAVADQKLVHPVLHGVARPRAKHLLRRQVGLVVGRERQVLDIARGGQELRQHAGAVDPFPPCRGGGHLVVLVPVHLVGDEPLEARLFHQLRQAAGKAERVGQPQARRLGPLPRSGCRNSHGPAGSDAQAPRAPACWRRVPPTCRRGSPSAPAPPGRGCPRRSRGNLPR